MRTLDIAPDALDHIRRKGGVLSIDQVTVKTASEPLPQTKLSFAAPEPGPGFDRFELEGVKLFVSRRVFFKKDVVRIRLGRLLGFRWLELPTQSLFATLD